MDKFKLAYNVTHIGHCLMALSPSTPPEVLEKLANDKSRAVRRSIATNPNTPPEVLEKLAIDEDWLVRYGVVKNTNTPKYIKIYLRYDN
jgi:predicted transcriptional regulator